MKHYKSLYQLPVANYFKIIETGNPAYLYVFSENDPESELDFNNPPEAPEDFHSLWHDKIYYEQDKFKTTPNFRNYLKSLVFRSKYLTENKPVYLSQAEILEQKIEQSKAKDNDKASIDELISIVEEGFDFKIMINKYEFPAAKFLTLYNRLIEKNEKARI